MVPPIRSMPRTPSRVSGRLLAAIVAGSPGSMARTPSQPRRKPTTSQPRSSAERVIERMQGLSPGTSPPPVRIPIRTAPPSASDGGAEAQMEALRRRRDVDLGAVDRRALPRLELGDGRRDRPGVDRLAGAVAQLGPDRRHALDGARRVPDPAGDVQHAVA